MGVVERRHRLQTGNRGDRDDASDDPYSTVQRDLMTFPDTSAGRPRIYIGESDNLRRRLAGNYRNPGPSRQTSLRINKELREHLSAP